MAKYGELWNLQKSLIKYRIVPSSFSNMSPKEKKRRLPVTMEILKKGYIDENIREQLELVVKRTNRFRYSNYYLIIGKRYLEYNLIGKKHLKNY